jgi:hypothetical protein
LPFTKYLYFAGRGARFGFEIFCFDRAPGGDKGSLSFTISDISLETFTYQSNHSTKAGQPGASIKGRLLKVKYLKVNDVVLLQSSTSKGSDENQQAA